MKIRMNLLKTIVLIFICGSLMSCGGNEHQSQKVTQKPKVAHPATKKERKLPYIHIYRYGDFSVAKAKQLKEELQKVYPFVTLADNAIVLPKECYYKPRDRYSGTGLLDDMKKYRNGGFALGLTNRIIYQKNEISPTFGVFGISYIGDSVSVISSLRPRTLKPLRDDEMQELMLHELGHAFGLPHCKDERCMMVDAEHGNKFAQTQCFCSACKKYLISNGWTL